MIDFFVVSVLILVSVLGLTSNVLSRPLLPRRGTFHLRRARLDDVRGLAWVTVHPFAPLKIDDKVSAVASCRDSIATAALLSVGAAELKNFKRAVRRPASDAVALERELTRFLDESVGGRETLAADIQDSSAGLLRGVS